MRLHGGAQLLAGVRGAARGRLHQQQHELLASPAPRHVHRARPLAQDARDAAQHLVAHGVREAVVHPLEVVDVGDRQRQVAPEAARALPLQRQRGVHVAPVEEPGERVLAREAVELGGLAAQHLQQPRLLLVGGGQRVVPGAQQLGLALRALHLGLHQHRLDAPLGLGAEHLVLHAVVGAEVLQRLRRVPGRLVRLREGEVRLVDQAPGLDPPCERECALQLRDPLAFPAERHQRQAGADADLRLQVDEPARDRHRGCPAIGLECVHRVVRLAMHVGHLAQRVRFDPPLPDATRDFQRLGEALQRTREVRGGFVR